MLLSTAGGREQRAGETMATVGFSTGNVGLTMLVFRLEELVALARASLPQGCGSVGWCSITRTDLVCCLPHGHGGDHNTAADGSGDSWPVLSAPPVARDWDGSPQRW